MATFIANRALNMTAVQTTDGTPSFSSTLIRITQDSTHYTEFTGTGFTVNAFGAITGGTLNGVSIVDGTPLLSATGISMSASTFYNFLQADDAIGAYTVMFAGADTFTGSDQADRLLSFAGNDTLTGGGGIDTLLGGAGDDLYVVTAGDVLKENAGEGTDTVQSAVNWILADAIENLQLTGAGNVSGTGNSLGNRITGNDGANLLGGGAGKDRLIGGKGNDTLDGGARSDTLEGGGSADTFRFRDALGSSNVDKITDFRHDTDKLQLAHAIFGTLAVGALDPGQFIAGSGLHNGADANDRIVYDTASGKLYYDADGLGGNDGVLFAVLGGATHPTLGAGDFLISA